MTPKRTLKGWRDVIRREVDFVDIKPYSHNIISIALQAIASQWSRERANQAIEDFELEELGWKKLSRKDQETMTMEFKPPESNVENS